MHPFWTTSPLFLSEIAMTRPTVRALLEAACRPMVRILSDRRSERRPSVSDSRPSASVARDLARMGPLTRDILALSQVDGLSVAEIADTLNISRRTVRRHLRRAIAIVARHQDRP